MRIASSTYRLQFHSKFTFSDAAKIISYLSDLGITDIYSSPIFKAKKGSTHGYDVTDPTILNPEIGTEEDFNKLYELRQAKAMGWLQDIVPNHMAFDCDNSFLIDLFENGAYSQYYRFFDVDWDHPYPNLKGKVLVPVLGEYYGQALQKRQIQLKFSTEGFTIHFYDYQFPIKMESYLRILNSQLSWLESKLGRENEQLIKFLELTQMLRDLGLVVESLERHRLCVLIKSKLWKFYTDQPDFKEYFDRIISQYNNTDQDHKSLELLDNLLLEQLYRLAFWKVGNEELNYRRFFTVNSLICMRIGNKEVFDKTHTLILKMIREGKFTGLRVDHLDGIYNPSLYLKRLRQEAGDAYVVVEKILDLKEELPTALPIQGTTGYDFLDYLNDIFVDQKNEKAMDSIYAEFIGRQYSYHQLVSEKKKLFMGRHMAGDIDNLAQLFNKIFCDNLDGRDLTMYGIRRAIVEIMAQFPIYRTYICDEVIPEGEKITIKEASVKAKNLNPNLVHELNLVEKVLLLDFDSRITDKEKADWLHFVQRFQQFSGPLMAKGAEDTTFYIYNRLISLNEVGNDPSVFGISDNEFHQYILQRKEKWPYAMNSSSTHDTKRSEDVRARINVLSEVAKEWSSYLQTWNRLNKNLRKILGEITAPVRNDEYLIYQTLLGAYPLFENELEDFKVRMKEYIVKAVREAKIHTQWLRPEPEYEQGCVEFIDKILDPSNKEFLDSFITFQKKISRFGILNSLSQTLIKLTTPGVPDIYQGCELWDFSLVDPDNRRSVDYDLRQKYLKEIKQNENKADYICSLLTKPEDGKVKQFLIYKTLNLRKQMQALFEKGEYHPLTVTGKYSRNVIAFMRKFEQQRAIIIVPRFLTEIEETGFEDTEINIPQTEGGIWKDVLTGRSVNLSDMLSFDPIYKKCPFCLLIKQS